MKSPVDKSSGRWRQLTAPAFYATLTVSCCAASAAETLIYKSIDTDGTPVFTDRPAPSATLVKPTPLNVMDAPRNPPADPTESAATNPGLSSVTDPASNAPTDPDAGSDTSPATDSVNAADPELPGDSTTVDTVTIRSPLDRQTLIDPEGPVWVEFSTSPAAELPKGMTAQVRLNDALVVTGGSTRLPLDVPERGAHRLQVILVDVSGKAVAESAPIEIYVKLPTVAGSN